MAGPLEGIRVIDCTQWIQGAAAGAWLGDMGAEVIKVEHPVSGDPIRGWLQLSGAQATAVDRNYYFDVCNRHKKGMTLDLKQPKGRDIMYRMVKRSDVLLHNWRAETPQKLGLDYETLSGVNPRLIYVEATGWGTEGPLRDDAAFEMTVMGRAGVLDSVAEPDMAPIVWPSGPGDMIGATVAVVGTLAALEERHRSGLGQKVNVSLLGSLISVWAGQFASWLVAGIQYPRRARARMGNPLWNHYKCGDDKWITLAMLQADRYWTTFCQAIGVPELENDPRFKNLEVRAKNSVELIGILDRVFATRPRAEWLRLFEKPGPGKLIYAPIQTIPEASDDPQVLANEFVVPFDHPRFGPIRITGVPCKFSRTPASPAAVGPEFGQHTEEVLLELGYNWEDLAQLKDARVI